jgi:hypothetical protein
MERGTILDFAAFHLIRSFGGYGKKYRFNKFMYLLDKELKKDDIDIKLPYSWYRHGVVVEYNIDDVDYISSLDFSEIPKESRKKVINIIKVIMDEYRYKTTDEVNKEEYQEAPYKIQDYFREMLEITKSDNTKPSELSKWLKKSLIEFPSDDFDDIYPLFLEWENYLEKLIEIDYPKKETKDFIQNFWFTFAEKLRLLTCTNINQVLIEDWEDTYVNDFSELEDFLFNFSFQFYSEYYTPIEKNKNQVKSEEELHRMASKTVWE